MQDPAVASGDREWTRHRRPCPPGHAVMATAGQPGLLQRADRHRGGSLLLTAPRSQAWWS
jgi:hypothetical protein